MVSEAKGRKRGRPAAGSDTVAVAELVTGGHFHYWVVGSCPYCGERHVHDGGPAYGEPLQPGIVRSMCYPYRQRSKYLIVPATVAAALIGG